MIDKKSAQSLQSLRAGIPAGKKRYKYVCASIVYFQSLRKIADGFCGCGGYKVFTMQGDGKSYWLELYPHQHEAISFNYLLISKALKSGIKSASDTFEKAKQLFLAGVDVDGVDSGSRGASLDQDTKDALKLITRAVGLSIRVAGEEMTNVRGTK